MRPEPLRGSSSPFDILRHIGDGVLRHMILSSTPPTYSLPFLSISPITLLGMSTMPLCFPLTHPLSSLHRELIQQGLAQIAQP
jgi:hypothetical protein